MTNSLRLNPFRGRQLTLLRRCGVLIVGEVSANGILWATAGIFLSDREGLLGLVLLAWTLGLRHGLDVDHIAAIDNAARRLVSLGQLPVTCGLWFSLFGHSTIVIVVNIAIAISVNIYDKLDAVGSVGGIIGASVSASFLFVIACTNIYYLAIAIKERRRCQRLQAAGLPLEDAPDATAIRIYGGGCLVRVTRPLLKAVNKPWKMFPVGVLFGLGFDTASSVALLAISAIAQKGPNGDEIAHGKILLLPLLFTAGMTFVDSLDSVLMLYAYTAPGTRSAMSKIAIFVNDVEVHAKDNRRAPTDSQVPELSTSESPESMEQDDQNGRTADPRQDPPCTSLSSAQGTPREEPTRDSLTAKSNTISTLSITLTVLSILVALSISLITAMGVIGENCAACREAAEDPKGGGLAGDWWRGWARANDQSGYIGAAIVGVFAAVLLGFWMGKWGWHRFKPALLGPPCIDRSLIRGSTGSHSRHR